MKNEFLFFGSRLGLGLGLRLRLTLRIRLRIRLRLKLKLRLRHRLRLKLRLKKIIFHRIPACSVCAPTIYDPNCYGPGFPDANDWCATEAAVSPQYSLDPFYIDQCV